MRHETIVSGMAVIIWNEEVLAHTFMHWYIEMFTTFHLSSPSTIPSGNRSGRGLTQLDTRRQLVLNWAGRGG